MKLNKKIIIPALSLLAGASLIGSVTGTIAWYQYSTRANVSYIGASGGTIGNLQIRIKGAAGEAGEWGTRLSIQDVKEYLSNHSIGQKVEPVTPGALGKNDSLSGKTFYSNPNVGFASYDHWFTASEENYVKIPLQLRFMEKDEDHLTVEDVYLSQLIIKEDKYNNAVGDISDAIRVHFSAYKEGDESNAVNHLVSKQGGSTATHGRLRLGNGSDFDKGYDDDDEFGFEGSTYHYIEYGGTEGLQTAYGAFQDQKNDIKYYENDELAVDAIGWEAPNGSAEFGEDLPDNENGNPGDLFVKVYEVNNEQKGDVYSKDNASWEPIEIASGTENPEGDLGKDYYLNTTTGELFIHSLDGENNHVWTLTQITEEGDINTFSADDYDTGDLALDGSDLYSRKPGDWVSTGRTVYVIDGIVLGSKNEFDESKDYFAKQQEKFYSYSGGVYKETISPILVSNVENSLKIVKNTSDKIIGKTVATRTDNSEAQKYLNVDVTIWVEGWHKFLQDGKFSSLWDKDYINAKFDVGFQFAVQDKNI